MKKVIEGYISEFKIKELVFQPVYHPSTEKDAKWMKIEIRDSNKTVDYIDSFENKKHIEKEVSWYKKVKVTIEIED